MTAHYREGTYYALPSHMTWEKVADARKRWDIGPMNAPVAMGPGVIAWGHLLYPLDYEVFFEDFGEEAMPKQYSVEPAISELQEQVLGILEANSIPPEINGQIMALVQKGEEWLANRVNEELQLPLDPEERNAGGPAMTDRLFIGIYPGGIVYADREREKYGDYLRAAFLPYHSLELVMSACDPALVQPIKDHAATIQARRGEQFKIDCAGHTVVLGR